MYPFHPGRPLATPTGAPLMSYYCLGCSDQPEWIGCCGVVRILSMCITVTPHGQRWPLQTHLVTMETTKSRRREKLCMREVCLTLKSTDPA